MKTIVNILKFGNRYGDMSSLFYAIINKLTPSKCAMQFQYEDLTHRENRGEVLSAEDAQLRLDLFYYLYKVERVYL